MNTEVTSEETRLSLLLSQTTA